MPLQRSLRSSCKDINLSAIIKYMFQSLPKDTEPYVISNLQAFLS